MKSIKNKNKTLATITLVLILTMSSIMTIMPVSAVVEEVEVNRFIFAFNPIGVNQMQTIALTVTPNLVNVKSVQEEDLLYNANFTLIKPDGTNETLEGPSTWTVHFLNT